MIQDAIQYYASRMIFGEEPVSVFCHSYNDPKTDVDIKGTSILTYKNNKTANVTYANGSYYQAKYEVWGISRNDILR